MRFVSLILFLITFSGCSKFRHVWGESPPPEKKVSMEQSGGNIPVRKILDGDDNEALRAIDYWERESLELFRKIKGKQEGQLSDDEVRLLIDKLIAPNLENRAEWMERLFAAKSLLGFGNRITRGDIVDIFKWLREYGSDFRRIYQKYESCGLECMKAQDFALSVKLASTFLIRGQNKVPAEELLRWVNPFVPKEYAQLRKALPEVLAFTTSSLESICGSRVEPGFWEGRKVGLCFQDLYHHFNPTLPWLDFALGKSNTDEEIRMAQESVVQLENLVSSWFQARQSRPFPLQKIVDLAKVTGVKQPQQFFDFMTWVSAFDSKSKQRRIRMEFFVSVSRLFMNWHQSLLKDVANHADPKLATRRLLEEEKIPNLSYPSWVENSETLERVHLYKALRDLIFETFDPDQDGFIELTPNQGLVSLIEVVFRFLDGSVFFDDLLNRLLQKELEDTSYLAKSANHLNLRGLAHVTTLVADLIVEEDRNRRTFWEKISSHLTNGRSEFGGSLDSYRLFAVLVSSDLLDSMAERWSKDFPLQLKQNNVDRRATVKHLPEILESEFPDIYESCMLQGFSRSCGIVMTEVLPSPLEGEKTVTVTDLQTMAVTALLTDRLLYRCDRNGDGHFSNSIFDGYDEKDCAIAGLKNLTLALMDSNLVEKKRSTQRLLKLVDSTEVFRWPLKIAMGAGTMRGLAWKAFATMFGFFQRSATVGELYQLAGEFMDEDKAKALRKGRIGPSIDPGDELLYTGELD